MHGLGGGGKGEGKGREGGGEKDIIYMDNRWGISAGGGGKRWIW